MRILLWHVHGSWTTAFVQGHHEYLLPVTPGRGPSGRGRAQTWDWPAAAVERTPQQLRDEPVDVVVLQRPEELSLVHQWLGRRPGRDVPTVYLEHDAPWPHPATSRHPLADQPDITLVHVTHFNRLYWDNGTARTRVIEHGVVDPGPLFTGDEPRAAAVVNEPSRRGRTVGTDLLPTFAQAVPVDVFGAADGAVAGTRARGDVPQHQMHRELARYRAYLHPVRWTSLGLSLIEAMFLGLPVVAVDATEVRRAVPEGAGCVSSDLDELVAAARRFVADPDAGRAAGRIAREHACRRYGVGRFLADWDALLEEVA